MIYMKAQGFFGRWKVYLVGHTEGGEQWIATFRFERDADAFIMANPHG